MVEPENHEQQQHCFFKPKCVPDISGHGPFRKEHLAAIREIKRISAQIALLVLELMQATKLQLPHVMFSSRGV